MTQDIETLQGGAILQFEGKYRFLSNFYPEPVTYNGYTYQTAEHAFQSAKAVDEKGRKWVEDAGRPGEAKSRGRTVTLRPDWEGVKVQVMYEVLRAKFSGALKGALLSTGTAILVEGNTWHDNTWGVCVCGRCPGWGENLLGNILAQVRLELSQAETNPVASSPPKRIKGSALPPSPVEDALDKLDYLLSILDDIPERGWDFAESVRTGATDMKDWIEENAVVTAAQNESIENWTDGAERWLG